MKNAVAHCRQVQSIARAVDATCTSSHRQRGQAMRVVRDSMTSSAGRSSAILSVTLSAGMVSIVTKPGSNGDSNVRDDCTRLHATARLYGMSRRLAVGGVYCDDHTPCSRCRHERWICEAHPERPWPPDDCPGLGETCLACNTGEPPNRKPATRR